MCKRWYNSVVYNMASRTSLGLDLCNFTVACRWDLFPRLKELVILSDYTLIFPSIYLAHSCPNISSLNITCGWTWSAEEISSLKYFSCLRHLIVDSFWDDRLSHTLIIDILTNCTDLQTFSIKGFITYEDVIYRMFAFSIPDSPFMLDLDKDYIHPLSGDFIKDLRLKSRNSNLRLFLEGYLACMYNEVDNDGLLKISLHVKDTHMIWKRTFDYYDYYSDDRENCYEILGIQINDRPAQ